MVQMMPVEVIYDANSNPMQLMMAIMELSRGHSESAVKSERLAHLGGQEAAGRGEAQAAVRPHAGLAAAGRWRVGG